MAGWTKMPLGMEVDLGPGDFVFDGDPAPPTKEGTAPTQLFWPISVVVYCGQTAGWIKVPLWYGDKPWPRRRCIRWGRSSP